MDIEIVTDILLCAAAFFCIGNGVRVFRKASKKRMYHIGACIDALLHAIAAVICIGAIL